MKIKFDGSIVLVFLAYCPARWTPSPARSRPAARDRAPACSTPPISWLFPECRPGSLL